MNANLRRPPLPRPLAFPLSLIAALILASASGLVAPVGRELDSPKTSVRAVVSVALLIAAVAAIAADLFVT